MKKSQLHKICLSAIATTWIGCAEEQTELKQKSSAPKQDAHVITLNFHAMRGTKLTDSAEAFRGTLHCESTGSGKADKIENVTASPINVFGKPKGCYFELASFTINQKSYVPFGVGFNGSNIAETYFRNSNNQQDLVLVQLSNPLPSPLESTELNYTFESTLDSANAMMRSMQSKTTVSTIKVSGGLPPSYAIRAAEIDEKNGYLDLSFACTELFLSQSETEMTTCNGILLKNLRFAVAPEAEVRTDRESLLALSTHNKFSIAGDSQSISVVAGDMAKGEWQGLKIRFVTSNIKSMSMDDWKTKLMTVIARTDGDGLSYATIDLTPPPSAPQSEACNFRPEDGEVAEQKFSEDMIGCASSRGYLWADLFPSDSSSLSTAPLCRAGWSPCTVDQYRKNTSEGAQSDQARGEVKPDFHYWLAEDLFFSGTPENCTVSAERPPTTAAVSEGEEVEDYNQCNEPETTTLQRTPMRVCKDADDGAFAATDRFGHMCNWTRCALRGTPELRHFGGCMGNVTAGVLCCRENANITP